MTSASLTGEEPTGPPTNSILDSSIGTSTTEIYHTQVLPPSEMIINKSNYELWTVDEVINWCIPLLDITEDHPLISNIQLNNIDGDVINDLSFEDCKELCNGSLQDTIKLRLALNKLKDNNSMTYEAILNKNLAAKEENMTIVLKNLCTTLSQRLQDYSTQYSKLRSEILDVVKTRSVTSATRGSDGSNTEFYEVPKSQPTLTGNITPNLSRKNTLSNRSLSPIAQSPTTRSPTTRSPTNHSFQPPQLKNHSNSSMSINTQSQMALGSTQKPKLGTNHSSTNVEHTQSGSSSNEPLKQLRASKDDSCEKILKNAMKRHGLNDQDWRQYVLVICYGDQERPLELDETPVTIFKSLKQQGLHPSIMLRRRGDFEELMVNGNTVDASSYNHHNPSNSSGGYNTTSPLEYSATPGGRL
ncbi:similar to Saccharomyces cerevisiae YCL032W STE50 Protein involved in mating response [Maudiozyma saulgeensis]|uniref:Similar to Saccharomyces cerevisiae YCL032W STE50 Protein involved in mating response n=1 Tax=Maudiozyma saulgeensis TaxID=1789683 RepID=A0A1X7R366_9SACH|nr:similar to Saccharomyces cerevisiae YCL032W STE50 Protein involved in mating response [Kazachstania saulgeensis]